MRRAGDQARFDDGVTRLAGDRGAGRQVPRGPGRGKGSTASPDTAAPGHGPAWATWAPDVSCNAARAAASAPRDRTQAIATDDGGGEARSGARNERPASSRGGGGAGAPDLWLMALPRRP